MKLTATKVDEIFRDCFFRPDEVSNGEAPEGALIAEGIKGKFAFHPDRTKTHKGEIVELLNELPDSFHESKGGGWSFLNACNDKHGNQWTGMHSTMEQLVVLGIAVGKVKFHLDREMWKAFPGGMPYFVVLDDFEKPNAGEGNDDTQTDQAGTD